jgi:hypothetical protein
MPVIRGVMSRSAEMGGVGAGSLNVSAVDRSDLRPTSIFFGDHARSTSCGCRHRHTRADAPRAVWCVAW